MSRKPISLAGHRAIVTGAGKGLGRAYAIELARRGAAVVVNDLDRAAADAVVDELVAAGANAVAAYDSAATAEGGRALTEAALENFGGVEILVNNAGVLRPGYFEDLSARQIDEVLDVHLRGPFYVTQPAWRFMKRSRYGRIVLTGSSSGMFGHQAQANYCAAKAGVYGLTKALSYEGGEHDIRVNMLLPYADSTIALNHPIPDMAENYARFVSSDQMGRLRASRRDPATVACLVAYLVSRDCAVTGEAFSVCNGRFGRVFVGVSDGWLARAEDAVSAEIVREQLPRIRDIERHTVPNWLFEECADVADRL